MQALEKLESVPDLAALDWRGTAEAAVRAALAGGAKECDVLVLRRKVDGAEPQAIEASSGMEGEARSGEAARRGWVGGGWTDRGGRAWSKRFLGSVARDGTVGLEEEDEGGLAPARGS